MDRRALTNRSNRWFDANSAKEYDEATEWDGNNHISLATGTQTEHESLYVTKSGVYVLHTWSQWDGILPQYYEISEDQAYDWLIRNEHFEAVPDDKLADAEV